MIKTFQQFINEGIKYTFADAINNMNDGDEMLIEVPNDVKIYLKKNHLEMNVNLTCGMIIVSCENKNEKIYKFYQNDSSNENDYFTLDELSNEEKKKAIKFLQTHEYEEFTLYNNTADWVFDKWNEIYN